MRKFTKETARRALRTFLQAFLPALAVGIGAAVGEDGSFTKGAIIALVVPAAAAGIAAVMNLEKEYYEVDEFVKDRDEDTITNADTEIEEDGEIDG